MPPAPFCHFESDRQDGDIEEAYHSCCIVCGLSELCIRTNCDACSATNSVIFHSSPDAECTKCNTTYGADKLLKTFVDACEVHLAVVDGGHYPFPLNCGECGGYEVVVEVGENQYLCTSCFALADEYGVCESCHDESTALGDDTMWTGCEFCDVHPGLHDDD